MTYIPHTDADRAAMLKAIGVESFADLFDAVPPENRFPPLNLPDGLSEMEVAAELNSLARANVSANEYAIFLGAGAYNHFIPSVVDHILRRGEFFTAYTPYQPELSQGTLQAIFEYQSMMCMLTGMDAANASHYDGATSLAEAVTMANAHFRGKRPKVILSPGIHPQYRAVVRTYHQNSGLKFVGDKGSATIPDLVDMLDDDTALLAVQYPQTSSGRLTTSPAWPTPYTGRARCCASSPTRSRWACSSRPANGARTLSSAKGRDWAFRSASAGRIWAFSPRAPNTCARSPGASSARR